MIRVKLPAHLRTLAQVDGEVTIELESAATQRSVLDALEACYPMLRGTIRDHVSQQRRPFLRFFACGTDLSHEPPEPLLIRGAPCRRLGGTAPMRFHASSERDVMHLSISEVP